ncbi:MAG: hypothetical protein QNJ37_01850 [Crocosphaera sp.]|nr:hypothetical protein [Crocosphaera sp.]
MVTIKETFWSALTAAGMPEIPEQFSVVPFPQKIPQAILREITTFIEIFERVTTRKTWWQKVTASSPTIARFPRQEVCFFSAWDFHLPWERPGDWQLIEFNDNGSGLLYAGLINAIFYQLTSTSERRCLCPPKTFPLLNDWIAQLVQKEAQRFFGTFPPGLFLILDDAPSLQSGKFQWELRLMRDQWRQRGWPVEIASPEATYSQQQRLYYKGQPVSFVVNRSTDFFWTSKAFSSLNKAYQAGLVYVAPNPFTYATRSDKRLLEFLSLPHWDEDLGIEASERILLSAHIPETYLIREDNLEAIASDKQEFFFKPLYGFASRGVLPSSQVGKTRLRRLLKKGLSYVAQKKVSKSLLPVPNCSTCLWTDLRVWAYDGNIFLLSGRGSTDPERLDLTYPGGWLPTYSHRGFQLGVSLF